MIRRKDDVPAAQPAAPEQEPACDQTVPVAAVQVPSEGSRPEHATAGIPAPLFILGMIGTGILGALFGAAAVKSPQEPESSGLAA